MNHTQSLSRRIAVSLSAVIVVACFAAPLTSYAAPMAKKATHAKIAASHVVYVCNECREFWTPAVAKKMKYTDSMGHKMVKVTKVPAGYMDGTKPGAM